MSSLELSFFLKTQVFPYIQSNDLTIDDWFNLGEAQPLLIPWILRQIQLNLDHGNLLVTAGIHGAFQSVRWIVEHQEISREQGLTVFLETCRNGHLKIAQWLAEYYHLIVDDVRENLIRDFQEICGNGHLQMIQWWVKMFDLTADDARVNNKDVHAFQLACARGHLGMAQWLAEFFQLTGDDVMANDNLAFTWAHQYGHLEVAQWLINHFNLTIADTQTINNRIIWIVEMPHNSWSDLL